MTLHVTAEFRPGQVAEIRGRIRRLLPEPVRRLLEDASKAAARAASGETPKDTGATARAWVAASTSMMASARNPMAAAAPLNYGRHSHKMPPTSALLGWLDRHGIDRRSAFPIARAIARRGTRGRFFMQRAAQQMRNSELPRLMREAVQRIENIWRGSR